MNLDELREATLRLAKIEKESCRKRMEEDARDKRLILEYSNLLEHYIINYLEHEVPTEEQRLVLQAGLEFSSKQNLPYYLKMSVTVNKKMKKYKG